MKQWFSVATSSQDGALDKDRYLVWDRLFSIEECPGGSPESQALSP